VNLDKLELENEKGELKKVSELKKIFNNESTKSFKSTEFSLNLLSEVQSKDKQEDKYFQRRVYMTSTEKKKQKDRKNGGRNFFRRLNNTLRVVLFENTKQ
jgi:hypothetical protein